MYIRCANCRISTRIRSSVSDWALCHACGRAHSRVRLGELGSTPHERFRRALAFTEEHGIDLASAYSVLLGYLPLDEARAAPQPVFDGRPGSARGDGPGYDPGFACSVAEGFLTPAQARARGDRVVHATRLARNHALTLHLAFLVADGRLTLPHALRAPSGRDLRLAPERSGGRAHPRWPGLRALAAATLVLLGVTAWVGLREIRQGDPVARSVVRRIEPRRARPTAPVVRAASEVRIATDGRVAEIVAASPREVLEAFCRPDPRRVPVGLASRGVAWVGRYREAGAEAEIPICSHDGARWRYAAVEMHPAPEGRSRR